LLERDAESAEESQGVAALDPETGKIQWRYLLTQDSLGAGVPATAGGIDFAASREGNFIAFDARSGKGLWHFQAGNDIPSSPMSYAWMVNNTSPSPPPACSSVSLCPTEGASSRARLGSSACPHIGSGAGRVHLGPVPGNWGREFPEFLSVGQPQTISPQESR
jgi:hypothetical protein